MNILNQIVLAINICFHLYVAYHIATKDEQLAKTTPFIYTLFTLIFYGILFNSPFVLLVFSITWYVLGSTAGYVAGTILLVQSLLAFKTRCSEGSEDELDYGTGRIYRAHRNGPLERIR